MDGRTSSSFGELLRPIRRRKRITQQQVAEKLGVHRSTVGTWERGDFLPESKGIVLELAKVLRLDDQETRQLLEASLTTLSPYWSLPSPRNPFFTGREEVLEELHRRLGPDQAIALTQSHAMYGLGGIGKTQLAIEYAYRHFLEYNAVFWIGAETVESILASFLHIAEVLQLPERHEADQQRVVAAVQRWLSTHKDWLLIWDNLEELELLSHFLPAVRQGAVLITTRRQALGTQAQGIELASMGQAEAMLFLLRRAKVVRPEATGEQVHQLAQRRPGEYEAAKELWRIMGGLPLALDQAGAYIEETGCSLADYLQRYERQQKRLLERRGMLPVDHPHSVMTTFRLATQRMDRDSPAAAALLRVCAFVHAEVIPEELFLGKTTHPGSEGEALVADASELDLAFVALRTFSLAQRIPELQALSVHRLVQAVLRESMSEGEQTAFQQHAIRLLNAAFPEVTHEVWQQCERLLPHVLTCALALPDHAQNLEVAEVLRKATDYLRERAQYKQAEPLLQRALRILEEREGSDNLHLVALLYGLATLYYRQGKYEQAEPLYQRALQIREQALGLEHPDVAKVLNNLALIYYEQGRYEQAEPLYQRALQIWEQALGSERLNMANPLYNLAGVYFDQGKYEQAEPLYQRALHVCEQELGSEHPHVAYPLSGLANLYREQRRDEQAESLYQRALHLREQALGPEHPDVADLLNGLALLSSERGTYEQAESLYQRALQIWEQTLGPEHPHAASSLNGLASLYCKQDKCEEAESLYQRALTIREQQLGQHHPETARSLAGLAMLYKKQGRDEQAEVLLYRACTIFEQRLGPEHPEAVQAKNDYSRLLEQRSKATQVLREEQSEPAQPLQGDSHENRVSLCASPENVPTAAAQETDPLAAFLATCCELHPRAWCCSADLWQAYEHWAAEHQERFPLSRGAFSAQLKAHSCRADRTKTARIWRGVALVKKER